MPLAKLSSIFFRSFQNITSEKPPEVPTKDSTNSITRDFKEAPQNYFSN